MILVTTQLTVDKRSETHGGGKQRLASWAGREIAEERKTSRNFSRWRTTSLGWNDGRGTDLAGAKKERKDTKERERKRAAAAALTREKKEMLKRIYLF